MTDEQEKEVKEVEEKLQKLFDEHPNLAFFVAIDCRDYQANRWQFGGNTCIRCVVDNTIQFILMNKIEHVGSITKH